MVQHKRDMALFKRHISSAITKTKNNSSKPTSNAYINSNKKTMGIVKRQEKPVKYMRVINFIENIKSLCKEGRLKNAVGVLKDMDRQGIRAEVSAYASLLQCCVENRALAEGKKVHNHMIEKGFILDLFLSTKLVVMYAKCKSLREARKVFDEMPQRNAVSWTTMIAAYAKHGKAEEALKLFNEMKENGVEIDSFSFASVLPACAKLGSLDQTKRVHEAIRKRGIEDNVFVGSGLVDTYVKCGSLEDARNVFDKMPEKNVVSWTAMIAGYAQNGQVSKARKLFDKMPERNVVSWNAMLAGYARNGIVDQALKLFVKMPERNVSSWNAMIAGFSHSGDLKTALEFFEKMPSRDVISWNTMISAYAQNWDFNEALNMYRQMQEAGVQPNSATFASALPACANSAAVQQAKEIHDDFRRSGLGRNLFVGSALVDMYAKCGSIEDARKVFDKMPERNVVSWTAMIGGYAINGNGKEALQLFKEMQHSGVKPNQITFAGVLAACHHVGLVDEGKRYFEAMSRDYNITPELGHYCCMIDILGRAGSFDEAKNLINKMPMESDADIWVSLLKACRAHNNIKLGMVAAKLLLKTDPYNLAHYVMIMNMCEAAGRLNDKENIRKLMIERRVKKTPGRSWIEIKKRIHSFDMGDKSHPETSEILSELKRLSGQMKEAGYVPKIHIALDGDGGDDDDGEEEHNPYNHSEKLAIAFGLLNTPPGMPLRIVNNVQVCDDCHSATKIISKIAEREIYIRDVKRIHYFKGGKCTCGDYW